MNCSRLLFAAVFAIVLLAGRPACASILPGEWFISGGYGVYQGYTTADTPRLVQAGGSQPYSAKLTGSSMFSGQLYYHLTPHLGLGLEFIQRIENGTRAVYNGNFLYSSSINHKFILASARHVFAPERKWNPYVIGGAGIDIVSIEFDGAMPSSFGPTIASAKTSSTLLAGSAGVGVEGSLASNLFAGAELGVLGTPSNTSNQIHISSELTPYLNVRLGFDFGGVGRQ